ncbi:RDD family protein [Colwellia hornerae]|uniref:RDD family protein n=1 Tax=Colwellia hornerae TaxID=89402 RepID=A0A5C6QSH4_9GAMM|nr:RDD family protein [Colwellia hornerae]TWX57669.1 RDD family protein [Colwellia hornerae]TWX62600.1 RDD family protein [Colwellia hornerae]TWX71511.1 RDD family protein [Colwellia hornerae]
MDPKIDFTSYTLAELHSAAEHIDSEQYPEQSGEINKLIAEQAVVASVPAEQAVVEPVTVDNVKRVGEKATRLDRFYAALIDGLIGIFAAVPIFITVGFDKLAEPTFSLTVMLLAYGLIAGLVLHGYLLYHYGQTIGKNFMSIRIENLDDSKASLTTIYLKRMIPMQLLSLVPFGGQIISGLVNPLFIFGKEKRCLHDYVAKTKVCYTNN